MSPAQITISILYGLMACVLAFWTGYATAVLKNHHKIFNTDYILEQKNLKALDSLWSRVHGRWFYAKNGWPLPEKEGEFTAEEVDILGVIRATFLPHVPTPKQETPNVEPVNDSIGPG